MLNVPNLVKHITQPQPHLQPRIIETQMKTVLDSTTGYMLDCRKLAKDSDREI